jgi:hypothetical protein
MCLSCWEKVVTCTEEPLGRVWSRIIDSRYAKHLAEEKGSSLKATQEAKI